MKVLWFTNTPCSATEKLQTASSSGGWLTSLEKELSINATIKLHVAFYFNKEVLSFTHNNTTFYPIYQKNNSSFLRRYLSRLFKTDNDKEEIRKLIEIVQKVQPDLIHIHGTENNFGLIQNDVKIPTVVSIQGLLSSITEKYYTGIPASIAYRFDKILNILLCKSIKSTYQCFNKQAIRERKILKLSKNIIGRTDYDRRITRFLSPNSNYFVGQEMLRPSFFVNEWSKDCFNKKIQIITVLSDGAYKGYETLLKTANLLKIHYALDFEWLVIGVSNQSNTIKISRRWLKLNEEDNNIILLGNLKEEEIIQHLKSSDIYCQMSHIENSPNSLCEAMILGMPIIASYAGGTSSLITNNEEGLLVQDGDAYIYAGAIVELANNYDKSKYLGKKARERALKRHDKTAIVNNLLSCYNRIINNQ